jgi:hypothetical protein
VKPEQFKSAGQSPGRDNTTGRFLPKPGRKRTWQAPTPNEWLPSGNGEKPSRAWLPVHLLRLNDGDAYAVYFVLAAFGWLKSVKLKHPSVYTIAHWTRLRRETVREKLNLLERTGWITCTLRGTEGQRQVTRYRVNDRPVLDGLSANEPNPPLDDLSANKLDEKSANGRSVLGGLSATPGSRPAVKAKGRKVLSPTPSNEEARVRALVKNAGARWDKLSRVERSVLSTVRKKLKRGEFPSPGHMDILEEIGREQKPAAPPTPAPEPKPEPKPEPVSPELAKTRAEHARLLGLVEAEKNRVRAEVKACHYSGVNEEHIAQMRFSTDAGVLAAKKAVDDFVNHWNQKGAA